MTILAAQLVIPALPYLLSFAAGAMLYVVVEELIDVYKRQVPGSGKSHEIKTKYCNDEKMMERVVFHPDYTYSDFVGQILPRVEKDKDGNEKLKYVFTPGPFTRMLKKAQELSLIHI